MKNFVILLILNAVLLVASDDDDKIVGGTTATRRIKYQVSLRVNGAHSCGGSIINNIWVLTAAHCLPRINEVYVGSNSLRGSSIRYGIRRKIGHPLYRSNQLGYDFGLIKTDRIIQFNNLVGPIALANRDITLREPLLVTGWGRTSRSGPIPNDLQQLTVNPINLATCARQLGRSLSPSILCTFISAGRGTCFGDSGGPLVHRNVLYGIVNAVIPCAVGYPDIQGRVFFLRPWITRTMNEN